MAKESGRDRPPAGKASERKDDREARLAAALRANLRRRKAAAKGADDTDGPGEGDEPST